MGKKYFFLNPVNPCENIYEMSEEEFSRITIANKKIFEVYRFEELFAIIIKNFLDFNKVILFYADKARLQMFYTQDYFQKRIDVNRAALNFLSTLNMYHDFIKNYIKNPEINDLFNNDASIQRCLVMRHYIQHVESFPIDTTLSYVNGDIDVMLTSIRFNITPSNLKIEQWERSTQNKYHKFFSANENIDLYDIINQGMDAIQNLQCEVRKTILYTEEYRQQKKFLLEVESKLTPSDISSTSQYRYYENDKEGVKSCFLATNTIEFIDKNTSRYACEHSFANQFITTAPEEFVRKCSNKIFVPEMNQRCREQVQENPNGDNNA